MKRDNEASLIKGHVGKTLVRLTVPMVFGIAGMVIFNLTDTFFVGRLGTLELAALSFTFPVVLVIASIALGLGVGASAVISYAIGKGDTRRVKRLTTDSLALSLLIVVVFVILGLLTIDVVFRFIGATPEIIRLIGQYMRIWYLGMMFVVVPMVGNNAIRATGDTKTPAIIMLASASVNILLDPLLIFGLGPFPRLGLEGAAIATVAARGTSFILSSYILAVRYGMLTSAIPSFNSLMDSWKRILFIGVPASATRLIVPLAVGIVTKIVANFGTEAVAAFGVASRIEFFAMAVIRALSSVIAPFVGQNWGAGMHERVKSGIRYSNRFSTVWGLAMLVLLAALARHIASLFNANPVVVSIIVIYLRIVPLGYGMQGIFVISTSVLNVLNKPIHAAVLTIVQMFVLYIPLAYAGAYLLGLKGVFSSLVLAYFMAGIIAYSVLGRILSREMAELPR